jgi:hypothetical protein
MDGFSRVELIDFRSGSDDALSRLLGICDQRLVVDVTMLDGSEISGATIGASSSSLILDRWDSDLHRPAGDPIVLDLALVAWIGVP